MTPPKWTFHAIAVATGVAAILALAPQADAQPKVDPKANPKVNPKVEPKAPPVVVQPKAPAIIVHPQFNSFPGFPAAPFNQPAYNPGPFYNPALNNPWMNQTRFIPVNPYLNQPFNNNPFVNNPFNNPFANNPFNNPFANNPFAPNPFVNNPFANPFASPFMTNPLNQNPFANPFGPASFSTPPIAIQQPGYLLYRGPDLQVNPWSGMVYRPLTGIARTADGSTFFHVPGTGLPTVTGAYAAGSGLYFDPRHGTFLNPSTGVISKPGMTNVFVPWIP